MKICELKNIIIYLLRKSSWKLFNCFFEFILLFIYLTYTLYYYLFVKNNIDRKRQMEYYKDVVKKPSDIGVSDGSS